MVARLEALSQGGYYRQARREGERFLAAFQSREALFQRASIGVVLARVAVASRICAVRAALEGCGEMNGRSDRAGSRIDAAARVDGCGFDLQQWTLT